MECLTGIPESNKEPGEVQSGTKEAESHSDVPGLQGDIDESMNQRKGILETMFPQRTYLDHWELPTHQVYRYTCLKGVEGLPRPTNGRTVRGEQQTGPRVRL